MKYYQSILNPPANAISSLDFAGYSSIASAVVLGLLGLGVMLSGTTSLTVVATVCILAVFGGSLAAVIKYNYFDQTFESKSGGKSLYDSLKVFSDICKQGSKYSPTSEGCTNNTNLMNFVWSITNLIPAGLGVTAFALLPLYAGFFMRMKK
jgi:hypothetical protein